MSEPTPERLIREILNTGRLDKRNENPNWNEFSIVFVFDDEGDVFSTYGYVYAPDMRWHTTSVNKPDVRNEVRKYIAELKSPDGKAPVKMLVQFNRRTNRYNVDFEYEDASRWKVTPENLDAIREQFRPNLGDAQ